MRENLILIENLIVALQDGTPLTDLNLAPLVASLGQISLFNLATAITALQIGVPGRLTIEAPSRVGGRIEIDWRPAIP